MGHRPTTFQSNLIVETFWHIQLFSPGKLKPRATYKLLNIASPEQHPPPHQWCHVCQHAQRRRHRQDILDSIFRIFFVFFLASLEFALLINWVSDSFRKVKLFYLTSFSQSVSEKYSAEKYYGQKFSLCKNIGRRVNNGGYDLNGILLVWKFSVLCVEVLQF